MIQFIRKHKNICEGLLHLKQIHSDSLLQIGPVILGNNFILGPNTVCCFKIVF